MSDDYYNFPGWLEEKFEHDFSRFPYIGARDKLVQMQKEKSAVRRVLETVIMRVKLTSLLGYITESIIGWKPSQGSEPNKLAEDLIKVFDEERNKRSIVRFLAATQEQCKKRHRYFYTVSVYSPAPLSRAPQSSLQDEMVVVSGQLVHKDAIAQYNNRMAQTVASLPGEWLLVDSPPHGMVDSFDGRVVCLVMEKQFSSIFQQYLPFRKDIGWYPYGRVTGFFKEPGFRESGPSLDVVMVEFRRPKPFQAEGKDFFEFLERQVRINPLIPKEFHATQDVDFLLASYVLPLLAKGSHIEDFKATPPEKVILQQYFAQSTSSLPNALVAWYANA